MCSFDIRRKGANQRQSSSTSFTNLCEKSLACKLSRASWSTETEPESNICFLCDQNEYISDKKQPKRLILHQVTTLKQDQMMWCAVGMADTGQKQNY